MGFDLWHSDGRSTFVLLTGKGSHDNVLAAISVTSNTARVT